MFFRATILAAAGMRATALSAQTPPPMPLPDVPQFTVPPAVRVVNPETVAMRKLLKMYSEEETGVCFIALLTVPVPENLGQMPVLRTRADNLELMPLAKMPAPPCKEDRR